MDYAELIKNILATTLTAEGNKRIRKDKNNTGSDDASGRVFKAIGSAVASIELDTASEETFRNIAAAFRAAAGELDAAAESL